MIYLLIASQSNTHVGDIFKTKLDQISKVEAQAWDIGIFMDDC